MALVIGRVHRRRLAVRDNPLDPDALPGKQVREFLVLRPDRKIFKNIGQHASPGRTAKMRPRAAGFQVGGRRATLISLTTGGSLVPKLRKLCPYLLKADIRAFDGRTLTVTFQPTSGIPQPFGNDQSWPNPERPLWSVQRQPADVGSWKLSAAGSDPQETFVAVPAAGRVVQEDGHSHPTSAHVECCCLVAAGIDETDSQGRAPPAPARRVPTSVISRTPTSNVK